MSALESIARLPRARVLATAIAAVVVFDVVMVQAPFLLFVGLPFMVAAWRYRGKHATTTVVLVFFCVLYLAVGIAFIAANGLHAPHEANRASDPGIGAGDFAFAYIGTPLAAWLGTHLVRTLARRRKPTESVDRLLQSGAACTAD